MLTRPVGWWDTAQYVDIDQSTLRAAEEWTEREGWSCVVRHAQRDFSDFWRKVDENRLISAYNKRGARVVEHPRASHHTRTA